MAYLKTEDGDVTSTIPPANAYAPDTWKYLSILWILKLLTFLVPKQTSKHENLHSCLTLV